VLERYAPENNTTFPVMTRFEKAKVLGLRTEQLARGADPMLDDIIPSSSSPSDIASAELDAKKTPYIIVRNLPNGSKEMWKIKDMIVLP